MSLRYIIDGYNITNHPLFKKNRKKIKDPCFGLVELIRARRLSGSRRNKVTIVFDGYPDSEERRQEDSGCEIIFSKKEKADEKIKKLVEATSDFKNIVVVSDDKEIKFFIRAVGAKSMSAEEFLDFSKDQPKELEKADLTYTEMHKINQELRKLWLK